MEHFTRFCVFAIVVLSAGATQVNLENSARILKTFSGSLTEIRCSSPHPCFHINDEYGPFEYNILPDSFGIRAKVAQDHTSVTLHINGTSLIDNVTVECSNVINVVSGELESLFHLTIQFEETTPAPRDLNYNEVSGVLSWHPPQPDINQPHSNASVDLQITHYIVYITDPLTQTTTNLTTSATEFETTNVDMPCDASVQVSAVNSACEGQASSAITVNACSRKSPSTTPKDFTLSTVADNEHKQEMVSSLSGGEIAAVAGTLSFVVLLIVSLSLIVAYCVVTGKHQYKRRSEKQPRETRPPLHGEFLTTLSPSIRSGQDSTSLGMPTMTLYSLPDVVESDGAKCSNEYVNQPWQYSSAKRGLIYAELAPTSPNIISQPSCVENTTYAVIDHTVQTDV